MAIYLRGNVYHYEFEHGGKRHRGSCETTNKSVAKQIEAKVRTEISLGNFEIGKKKTVPTLKEFWPTFEKQIIVDSKKETPDGKEHRTVGFYRTNYQKILTFKLLANKPLDEITEKDLLAYTAHCAQTEQLADGTINRRLATLRKAMYLAKSLKEIKAVPEFKLLREAPPRDFVLGDKMEQFYLSICPTHLYEAAVLLVESGMRLSEALRLEWADVHFTPRGIGTRPYIHCRGTKSRGSLRNIPLSKRLETHIRELELGKQGRYVLHAVNDVKKPASKDTLEDAHQRLRKKYSLPDEFVLHSLRHTMLTRLGESGADAFTIKEIAGHSTITMSQRYVHPTAGMKERVFEMLDNFRAGSPHSVPTVRGRKSPQKANVPTKSPTVEGSRRAMSL